MSEKISDKMSKSMSEKVHICDKKMSDHIIYVKIRSVVSQDISEKLPCQRKHQIYSDTVSEKMSDIIFADMADKMSERMSRTVLLTMVSYPRYNHLIGFCPSCMSWWGSLFKHLVIGNPGNSGWFLCERATPGKNNGWLWLIMLMSVNTQEQ